MLCNLKTNNTIDQSQQKLINHETNRWHNVLKCIVASIMYLAEHNLTFRSSSDMLYTAHNDNFLVLAEFDQVLKDHLMQCSGKSLWVKNKILT